MWGDIAFKIKIDYRFIGQCEPLDEIARPSLTASLRGCIWIIESQM